MKVKNVFFVFVILFGICNILYAQRQYETLKPTLDYSWRQQTIINDKPVPPKVGRPGIFWENEKNRSEKNDVYYKPDTITLFIDTPRLNIKERGCIRYVMAYNKQGLIKSVLWQKLNKSKWETTVEYLYKYDSRKNLVLLLNKDDYGMHRQIQKYDERNNLLTIEKQYKGYENGRSYYFREDSNVSFFTKLKENLSWTPYQRYIYIYIYIYDSVNQIVSEFKYDRSKNKLLQYGSCHYEYDLRGNLTTYEENRFYANGIILKDTSRFTYDNRNNLLTMPYYTGENNTYYYDEKDNLIQRIKNYEEFGENDLFTYTYNERNNLTSVLIKRYDNEKKEYVDRFLHTYSYDNKDNLLYHFLDEWNKDKERWENKNRDFFDYDERNNLIRDSRYKKRNCYDCYDEENKISDYTYDEKNNLIWEVREGEDCKYSYDQQGRILSIKVSLFMKYTFSYDENGYGLSRTSWKWDREEWKLVEGYRDFFYKYDNFLTSSRWDRYNDFLLLNDFLYDEAYFNNKKKLNFAKTTFLGYGKIYLEDFDGTCYKIQISYKKIIL